MSAGLTAKQVADACNDLVCSSDCDEFELYEALLQLSDGWQMRYDELADERNANTGWP